MIVVPGFRTGDRATAPLRAVPAPARIRRARLGPRDQPWPSGERPRPARRNRSGRCHGARSDGPCRLELGGVIVREVARELPDHVDGVVLFGSPIIGGPMHTIAARTFDQAEAAPRNGRAGSTRRRAAGTGARSPASRVDCSPIGLAGLSLGGSPTRPETSPAARGSPGGETNLTDSPPHPRPARRRRGCGTPARRPGRLDRTAGIAAFVSGSSATWAASSLGGELQQLSRSDRGGRDRLLRRPSAGCADRGWRHSQASKASA